MICIKLDWLDKIFLIFLAISFAFNIYLATSYPLQPDEGTHLLLAEFYKDLISNFDKHHFNFEKIYDFSISYLILYPKLQVFSYPPVYHLSTGLLYFLSFSAFVGRFVTILYFLGTAVLIYKTSELLFNRKNIGIIAAILFSLTPFTFSYASYTALTDYASYFWSFLAIFLFLKGIKNNNSIYLASSGVSSALTFLSRYQSLVIVFTLMIYYLLSKDNLKIKLKGVILIFVPFLILVLPYVLVFLKLEGLSISKIIVSAYSGGGGLPKVFSFAYFFYYFYAYLIQTFFVGLLLFLL